MELWPFSTQSTRFLRHSLALLHPGFMKWNFVIVGGDTKPLQWKLCKGFETSSNQVLDMQFGVSFTSLKLVAAYSNDHVKVFELLHPLELKNWQLQAEFQNVIDSVSKFGKVACLSASISWTPQRGESQQLSFVLGFNLNVMQLNSAKVPQIGPFEEETVQL
ncbi:Protein SEH1 [Camellia lanceoleosa]|uniref:Protein SEH1 n=1 Tax=Camellia lanceoleosa TaxID=1840588 RepID=A0ACC0HL94_9ERIC|nr:Protein SEH1 [Camellia lanceoleosa]